MLSDIVRDPRVDDPHTTLEAVVEVTLSSATSKNLGLDDHVVTLCRALVFARPYIILQSMRTNGLGYLLGLLCVVSDIALGDLDAILSELSVPVSPPVVSLTSEHTESRSCAERHS